MTVTAAIRRMLDAGLTIEQALIAAEAFEAESVPIEVMPSKRQQRNKRYYERLKSSEKRLNAPEKDVSVGDALPPSPGPLSPPPTPPPIIPQTPSTIRETKRATRLSPDWTLPASWGRWAVDQGHSEAHVRLEAEKFRDFWCSKSGKDATKLDWMATWRNWIRNSKAPSQRGQPPPKLTHHQQRHQDALAAADKFLGINSHEPEFTGNTFDLEPGDFRSHG